MQHQEGQGHEPLAFFFKRTHRLATLTIVSFALVAALLGNALERFFRRSRDARDVILVRMALRLVPIVN